MRRLDVAIVGSGFAGSILARILQRQGHRVLLCERGTHPRFALGESSTPLASICLERLAARYDLADLAQLAAYGRWIEHLPHLRRGLKRGFTFYQHRPGEPYRNGPDNNRRLLVAASPSEAVADSHWLRADVDAFLVERAVAAGVEYLDRLELDRCDWRGDRAHLQGRRLGRSLRLKADFVVDGSGAGGFLARCLEIPSREWTSLRTDLVFGHFEGVASFPEVASDTAAFPPGPYPDERAAVHHLLEEGWMYVLPFDHGLMSAGFVLDKDSDPAWTDELDALPPERAWERLLARYPTLGEQFEDARSVRPIGRIRRLQRRLTHAAGTRWALLPHSYCFLSPLFSTGIAWSLLAVERLALVLEPPARRGPMARGLATYGTVLEGEADYMERLVRGAYRLRGDFDLFTSHSYLYFVAASFAEAAQRLLSRPPSGGEWAWAGFLGAADPAVLNALDWALATVCGLSRPPSREEKARFAEDLRQATAPRNVAGLADPRRKRLYPVDLECLVDKADLLGLTPEDIRKNLNRLRGGGPAT